MRPICSPLALSRVLHGTRGLKHAMGGRRAAVVRSRPSRDAWIETWSWSWRRVTSSSRVLHGTRGLKLGWCMDDAQRASRRVLHGTRGLKPRRSPTPSPFRRSRPSRDAWIETALVSRTTATQSRRVLHGTRGLKRLVWRFANAVKRRVLHGTRGLKHAHRRLVGHGLEVASFTGRVD